MCFFELGSFKREVSVLLVVVPTLCNINKNYNLSEKKGLDGFVEKNISTLIFMYWQQHPA